MTKWTEQNQCPKLGPTKMDTSFRSMGSMGPKMHLCIQNHTFLKGCKTLKSWYLFDKYGQNVGWPKMTLASSSYKNCKGWFSKNKSPNFDVEIVEMKMINLRQKDFFYTKKFLNTLKPKKVSKPMKILFKNILM